MCCLLPTQMTNDKMILTIGAELGGCLVDGMGDGVMVVAPGQDKGTLRSLSFGLLQVEPVADSFLSHEAF